jgi:hypothetical protein
VAIANRASNEPNLPMNDEPITRERVPLAVKSFGITRQDTFAGPITISTGPSLIDRVAWHKTCNFPVRAGSSAGVSANPCAAS